VRPEAQACARPPSDYLRRFVFDTVTHRREATSLLISLVGADRVAYGTDMPFDMMAGSLESQVPADLADADRAQVAAETARAWFGAFPDTEATAGRDRTTPSLASRRTP
jgi:aminocarboxymuconate-semialdehyde decarboxylase